MTCEWPCTNNMRVTSFSVILKTAVKCTIGSFEASSDEDDAVVLILRMKLTGVCIVCRENSSLSGICAS